MDLSLAVLLPICRPSFLSNKDDGTVGPGNKNQQFDPNATGTWSIPDFIAPAGAHTGDPGTTLAAYTLNPLTV